MPVAPVDNNGTQLFYEDTGAPSGLSVYRTLVLVHGAIFNGATFKLLSEHNVQHGMRLVAINMRDYRGSTPYTEYDLEALRSGDRGRQQSMIRARGLEIAAFLTWFIRQQKTPPMSDDGRTGGLALLGWSWGNAMTMAFMAQAPELPEDDRCLLNTHFRSLIILDSARHGLGVPPTVMEGLNSPGHDTDRPDESDERWLSWTVHYAHSKMVLDAFPSVNIDDLRAGVADSPIAYPLPEHMSSRDRMIRHLGEIIDPGVVDRSQLLFQAVDWELYADNVQVALLDASTWPHLRVYLLWCDASVPETVFSSWYLTKQTKDGWPSVARTVIVVRFEGANHFPHWFRPDETMELLAEIV